MIHLRGVHATLPYGTRHACTQRPDGDVSPAQNLLRDVSLADCRNCPAVRLPQEGHQCGTPYPASRHARAGR